MKMREGADFHFAALPGEVMMNILYNPSSLHHTVQNVSIQLIEGERIPDAERDLLIQFIISRMNRHRGFLFYPNLAELQGGIPLLTGEKPRTRLLAVNAAELEVLRVLALIGSDLPVAQELLRQADRRLERQCFANFCLSGECRGISIAYLRYRTACGLAEYEPRIRRGLQNLAALRDGNGGWKGFPFYYTLLWLLELPGELSEEERWVAMQGKKGSLQKEAASGEGMRAWIARRALEPEPVPA